MVSLDDVKDLMLYKRPFFLPVDPKNKKKGSVVMLLSPNYKSSMNMMNAPYIINKRSFESYYIEKSIQRYIKNESVYIMDDPGEYLFEVAPNIEVNIDPNSITKENIAEDARALDIKYNKEILDKISNIDIVSESVTSNDFEKKLKIASFVIKTKDGQLCTVYSNEFKNISFPYTEFKSEDNMNQDIVESCNKDLDINPTDFSVLYDFNYVTEVNGKQYFIEDYLVYIKEYEGTIENLNGSKYRFVKFLTPGQIALYEDRSKPMSYFLAKYGTRLIKSNMLNYANEKLGYKNNIIFSGYDRDIKEVSKYFTNDILKRSFDALKEKMPKYKVHVMCSDSPDDFGYLDERNIIVYTPNAFKKAGFTFNYKDYIEYTAQMYAIYVYNPKVYDKIAEPSAMVLTEIIADKLDEEDKKGKISGKFLRERVYWYILDKYGLETLKYIIRTNNIEAVYRYTKEYFKDSPFMYKQAMDAVSEAEEEKKSDITSLDDISNLGQKIKRKIRSQSVYKLNKIVRDIQRGNTGTETRGGNSLNRLQSGNIVQTADVQAPSVSSPSSSGTSESFSKYKYMTDNDYVMEGNIMYLFEDNINYNMALRNTLYQDRFKSIKEVLEVYKKVKAENPWIRYTYTDLNRYFKANLFFDLSYYNESFFRNLPLLNEEDRANTNKVMKIYAELMTRLLRNNNLSSYTRQTIFIPVLDWRHNNSTRMWMYREDVNPISIIYNMIRTDKNTLIKLFGDNDVVFLGAKNYFKVNFRNVDFNKNNNLMRFTNLIKRIVELGYSSPADPDPEGEPEYTPAGIAMSLVNKIEKAKGIEINDISAFKNLNHDAELTSKDPAVATISNISKNVQDNIAIKNDIVDKPVIGNTGGIDVKNVSKSKETINVLAKNKSNENIIKAKTVTVTDKEVSTKLGTDQAIANTKVKDPSVNRATNAEDSEIKKAKITEKIAQAASTSANPDDALDKLDTDEFKEMIESLANDTENKVKIDKARASKMAKIEDEFHKKEIQGKSIRDLLKDNPNDTKLPKTSLPVASINDDWKNMTFMNFDKNYDPDADIIKMLDSMKNWTYPVVVRDVTVVDNSSSEDVLDLWTIQCEDYRGTKFTLKVDIPRFIEGNFLKLRGNEKVIMIQSTLIPIIKSDTDECQIIGVGGYNKIFVRKYGSSVGKSMPSSNRLIRSLNKFVKNNKSTFKVEYGDNRKICDRYELPIDYIDIAGVLNTIESKNYKIYFNQDELRLHYQVDDTKGLPIGIQKRVIDPVNKTANDIILYYTPEIKKDIPTVVEYIGSLLCSESDEYSNLYNNLNLAGVRYTYSEASILSSKIPMIIVLGYLEGLTTVLSKAGIKYEFVQKLPKEIKYSTRQDYIEFDDGYLVYDVNYSSSLLLNGFKRNDTANYSIKEVNGKQMYLDFLESYGGSLKADGLENSYDCMIDPITKEILEIYKLPTDYVGLLLHANNLLADNKYIKHTDQSVRRWRRKELIAGYFYKALSSSYHDYANANRRTRRVNKMTMKQSAVIDLILSKDPTTNDLSINNIVNDVECTHTVTNKGLVGMNTDRAYSVDKRGFDNSMLNVLGMDTAFSGNVGINRQATIDANIEGNRGFVKSIDGNSDNLSVAKTLTITEAIVPLGSTHDDPQRTMMTYMQSSKHMIRCETNDPLLVTNGSDEALPYLTSDIFAFKAKQDGTVIEVVHNNQPYGRGDYMIVEYKDGSHDYVSLEEEIKKNSDGGYSIPLQLSTELKVGNKFKSGSVLAYDKLSFSRSLGESGNLSANIGTLAKVAIITTDEGFEDSAAITETFANKIGTQIVMPKEIVLDKGSNVNIYKGIGDYVMEGESFMSYSMDFDDDVANTLMKQFSNMSSDQLSDVSINPITSKYTGEIVDIKVYRTVELDELSPSLRDFVKSYENEIIRKKRVYNQYGIDTALLPPTKKSDRIGKTKDVMDGVKIIFYIKYTDKMSVGDKITFYSANKGIIKYIIPKELEPYTDFRKDETIDAFVSVSSCLARMTCSNILYTSVSKLMVELDRSVKDILGIPYDVKKL